MSDAWEEIQALKSKRNSLREKLEKRKKERQNILAASLGADVKSEGSPGSVKTEKGVASPKPETECQMTASAGLAALERRLLRALATAAGTGENDRGESLGGAKELLPNISPAEQTAVDSLLLKFDTQKLITVRSSTKETGTPEQLEVTSVDHVKLTAVVNEFLGSEEQDNAGEKSNTDVSGNADSVTVVRKRKGDDESEEAVPAKASKISSEDKKANKPDNTDIMSLLSMPSSREKAVKRIGEEIMDLLSKPTAKEKSLAEKFKSQGGAQVMEFCPHGTRAECLRNYKQTSAATDQPNEGRLLPYICRKLHFKKIIQSHTDESLGDCSFLNTCFHMDTCKYVHYEVDSSDPANSNSLAKNLAIASQQAAQNGANSTAAPILTLYPPQWVQCDLRYLDMNFLGKFAVIMADPPWDIHMELPYGTMSDDEMRRLGVPQLQDSGLIFLWVTGRAMELGRECLKLWGYQRVDELIWVKTNQLQRIIRTGRTGHWLNHGKEHCLVGMKGTPPNLNRGLDCDVIVAEVRATSHKPDEIYGIIERLSPGTRKIELFGRPHNVQPNWITLGNQVDGVRLVDTELIAAFKKRYPDGNCMVAQPPDIK